MGSWLPRTRVIFGRFDGAVPGHGGPEGAARPWLTRPPAGKAPAVAFLALPPASNCPPPQDVPREAPASLSGTVRQRARTEDSDALSLLAPNPEASPTWLTPSFPAGLSPTSGVCELQSGFPHYTIQRQTILNGF